MAKGTATVDDLRALGEDSKYELIDGVILEKAVTSIEHVELVSFSHVAISRRFNRQVGGKWPGGWWITPDLHIQYESGQIFVHDNAGFRRDRVSTIPRGWPTKVRPDWACEVLSRGHKKRDRITKWNVLWRAKVPHYWLVDPEEKLLEVMRWTPEGYIPILQATSGQVIRAEPFDAVELRTDVLFGDEDDEE